MNILYIHPAGSFGGASKSLVELFQVLKHHNVTGYVITPKGSSANAFAKSGMHTIETLGLTQFDNTRFGYYRKWRWLILIRELFFLPFSVMTLMRAKCLAVKFDLIHINEITLLPVAVMAKWVFHVPMVMHIRSLQRSNSTVLARFYYKVLRKTIDTIICIDETVKYSVPANIDTIIIHNGINVGDIKIGSLKTYSDTVNIGLVGVLLRLKGVYEFIEAAKILATESKIKTKFILVGENARKAGGIISWFYKKFQFSEDVYSGVEQYIKKNNLLDQIELRGSIADITTFYPEIDILCFPSYLNACGRPVFEAAFFGIPSIVAVSNPKSDTIQHGVTGVTIEKPDPRLLADAILLLVNDCQYRLKLGKQAKSFVNENFDINKNAKITLLEYKKLVAR
jgi:glycosyltransferase involved in cell wall biosynthesis